ncbi:MAG: hypothetical protein CMC93_00770 [Flavobacteriaceae bacterium]|nr:hypothetical protein [Flavobacteriaceae bacterium]
MDIVSSTIPVTEISISDLLKNVPAPEVSISDLALNIFIGVILSFCLGFHYIHRSKNKSLRRDLGFVLPIICLTTLLVISVVKSSLALSLGLVGALSIVRFRTPIKEPEELAYIFLAIAIGLSLGADQRQIAVISLIVVLAVLSIIELWSSRQKSIAGNILLSMEAPNEKGQLEKILGLLESTAWGLDIRRIDQDPDNLFITAVTKFPEKDRLLKFCQQVETQFPNTKVSIIDNFSFPNE